MIEFFRFLKIIVFVFLYSHCGTTTKNYYFSGRIKCLIAVMSQLIISADVFELLVKRLCHGCSPGHFGSNHRPLKRFSPQRRRDTKKRLLLRAFLSQMKVNINRQHNKHRNQNCSKSVIGMPVPTMQINPEIGKPFSHRFF